MSTIFPIWILISWILLMIIGYKVLRIERRLKTPMEVSMPNFGLNAKEEYDEDDQPDED